MKVQELRNNLKDARNEMAKRRQTPPMSNRKKLRSNETPFILMHTTSNDDILSTDIHILTKELKSIYKEKNLFDAVIWDELTDTDIIEMITEERDLIKSCIDEAEVSDDDISSDDISNNNDMDIDDFDTRDDDDDEEKVQSTLISTTDTTLTQKPFNMNLSTTDDDIYSLNHARAQSIAAEYALREGNSQRQQFVKEATTEALYDYLLAIRNHIIREKEFEDFNFGPDTKEVDIKKLPRDQLKSFIYQLFHKNKKPVGNDFFEDKADFELALILLQERDMMIALQNHPSPLPQDKPLIPEQPYENDSLTKKRQNLNGSNIDQFIPKKSQSTITNK